MDDLAHWDFAQQFDGWEAAALILGIEPRESQADEGRVRVVAERMEQDYKTTVMASFHDFVGDPLQAVRSVCLKSVRLERLELSARDFDRDQPLSDWFANSREQHFSNQQFSRSAIAQWLDAIGMASVYVFDSTRQPRQTGLAHDIDPADLPDELHAANVAFRAVLNGYGDQLATFRNRLIGYLQVNYKDLSADAVARIATVANPDKAPGRKRRQQE